MPVVKVDFTLVQVGCFLEYAQSKPSLEHPEEDKKGGSGFPGPGKNLKCDLKPQRK